MKRILLLWTLLLGDAAFAAAEVGELAPELSTLDQRGQRYELFREVKKRDVLIVFYRGHW